MIRVLICEDQRLVRDGLVTILSLESGIEVVGEASNGEDAVKKAAALMPDVVLMDVQMPVMDGVAATGIITTQFPDIKVIILTTYDYEEYVLDGVKAGALGYVLKDTAAPELVETISRVHGGERFIQPAVAGKILYELAHGAPKSAAGEATPIEPLSEREVSILSRLAQGMSNREVAADLSLAEGTVKNRVSAILSKLQAANRVQAINLARQHKLI